MPKSLPPNAGDIKKSFPWGQLKHEKKDWTIRFGLMSDNNLNCDIWLDLKD